eukprot:2096682-Ditylum_brightwellii.AAC.1
MIQTRHGTCTPLRPCTVKLENSSVTSTKYDVIYKVMSCSSGRSDRALSYLESSGVKNNKRVELSSCSGGMKQVDNQNSNLIANTGHKVLTGYLGCCQPTKEPPAWSSSCRSQKADFSSTRNEVQSKWGWAHNAHIFMVIGAHQKAQGRLTQ